MTNDAKLGLVVGIGTVILIAIVFFRKDPALPHAPEAKGPAHVQSATVAAVPPAPDSRSVSTSPAQPHVPADPQPLTPATPYPQAQ